MLARQLIHLYNYHQGLDAEFIDKKFKAKEPKTSEIKLRTPYHSNNAKTFKKFWKENKNQKKVYVLLDFKNKISTWASKYAVIRSYIV